MGIKEIKVPCIISCDKCGVEADAFVYLKDRIEIDINEVPGCGYGDMWYDVLLPDNWSNAHIQFGKMDDLCPTCWEESHWPPKKKTKKK